MTAAAPGVPSSWKDIFLNVDLHALTKVYVDRLSSWRSMCDAAASLSPSSPQLLRLVYRYELLWLPLVANWRSTTAPDPSPPADVYWIWHLHMLRARSYHEHCVRRFQRVLPHRLRPVKGSEAAVAAQETAAEWRRRYPSEPFDLPVGALSAGGTVDSAAAAAVVTAAKSRLSLADFISAAIQLEFDFVYQVSLPHVGDANFLYTAVERYRKLLLVRRQRSAGVVRRPVDVQLIERVHALHPVQFADDIRRLFDVFPPADIDPDCDSSPSAVDKSDAVWRSFFRGERLFVSGTAFRGRRLPVSSSTGGPALRRFPRESFAGRAIDSCHVTFTSVTVDELFSQSGVRRVTVEARLLGENSADQQVVFRQSGPVAVALTGGGGVVGGGESCLGTVHFDAHRNRGIELVVDGRRGFACFARRRQLTTKLFNPVQHCVQSGVTSASAAMMTISLPKITYTDPKITLCFSIQAATPKPRVFTLDRNPATLSPVSSDLRPFVGSRQTWSTVMGSSDSLFHHARHGLKCREGGLAFGVEVIKQDQTDLGAVLVYHNNQNLVAVAYSIDADQLPDPCQVSETCPLSFDVREGDHAMLIRNDHGDFAVCIARWQHAVGGVGERNIGFRMYFVNTKQSCQVSVREDEMMSIKVQTSEGNLEIDLPTGRLTVDSAIEPLVEYLALAFSVGVLFVTLQKYQATHGDNWPTGSVRSHQSAATGRGSPVPSEASRKSGASRVSAVKSAHMSVQKRKAATKRRKMSASFTFLLACGLQIDVALYGTGNGTVNGSVGRTSVGSVRRHDNGKHATSNGHVAGVDDGPYLDVRL